MERTKLQYTEDEAIEAVLFLRHLKAHREVQTAPVYPGVPMCRICGATSKQIRRAMNNEEE